MAREGWDLDPRVDATFFEQWSKRFQQYSKGIEKGVYDFDPKQLLGDIKNKLEELKPLALVDQVAELCAQLPPLEVDKKGKPVEQIQKSEVVAFWQLVHFQGIIDVEKLQKNVDEVTWEGLIQAFASYQAAKEALDNAQSKAASITAKDAERQNALEDEIRKTDEFQAARTELLNLVGGREELVRANGEREIFEPQSGKYEQEWQAALRSRYESLGGKHDKRGRGRGLAPDAKRVQAERSKRKWSQGDLVDRIKKVTGIQINVRTIRRLEAGQRVDPATLRVVAQAFGLELEDLIKQ